METQSFPSPCCSLLANIIDLAMFVVAGYLGLPTELKTCLGASPNASPSTAERLERHEEFLHSLVQLKYLPPGWRGLGSYQGHGSFQNCRPPCGSFRQKSPNFKMCSQLSPNTYTLICSDFLCESMSSSFSPEDAPHAIF